MSQEIIEGIQAIEKEKGIEEGVLITALEDALRAAYKKTPGATRHAEVKLDDEGEFRVYGIEIQEDIETRLVEEAREARIQELERLMEETGERQHTLITDDDLDLDWSQVPPNQIQRTDVTPDNFGRIAAQTAKQVSSSESARPSGRSCTRSTSTGRARSSRDRPAGRRPQQRPRRPRSGGGSAPALRAGRRRALRAGQPDQGRHRRGALGDEGPAGHPLRATRS